MKDIFTVFYILGIGLFYSCSGNNESHTIKYGDIGDQSQNEKEIKMNNVDSSMMDQSNFNLKNLNFKIDTVVEITNPEFLDRFENKSYSKQLLISTTDSIEYRTWTYDDTLSTLNAFYNLLDCFGEECAVLDLYSEEYSSASYNLLFVSDNYIQWISSIKNQNLIIWEKYINTEFNTSAYHFIIEQKKNEKLKWLEQNLRPNSFTIIKKKYDVIK